MNRYNVYSYIFPPRPENKIPSSAIEKFDMGKYISEPKLNGNCCLIFTNGKVLRVMNRHNEPLTHFKLSNSEINMLHNKRKGWLVLVGEYMYKSQIDEVGELFNNKLVLFDILVLDGQHLLGTTFDERYHLLNSLYGKVKHDKPYLTQVSKNIYKVVAADTDFKGMYDYLTQYQMYEGIVLKSKTSKLKPGLSEKNNIDGLIKVRKETKNYSF